VKRKIPKARNPFVLAMKARTQGVHRKSKKSDRAKTKQQLKKEY